MVTDTGGCGVRGVRAAPVCAAAAASVVAASAGVSVVASVVAATAASRSRARSAAVADGDRRRVVAERLQRLARLGLGLAQQVGQAAPGDVLADRIDQRQRDAHVLGLHLVEAGDVDLLDLGRVRRAAGEQDDGGGDETEGGWHGGG